MKNAESKKPELEPGTSGSLVRLHAESQKFDNADFRSIFLGVLSCYVPAHVWEYAIEKTKEQLKGWQVPE